MPSAVGGLHEGLSEGDLVIVFSEWGEIVDVNLVRHKDTGKSKGFGFLCYEDQRSTVLAVDNMNGTNLLGRTLRVDHVDKYKAPMTDSMRIGWHEEEVFNERFPRQSCNETRYNDAVVKAKWTIRGGIIGQR